MADPKTPAGRGRKEAGKVSDPAPSRLVNKYRAGAEFERRIRIDLTGKGFRIIRSAGSKGKIDLLAGREGLRLAVQCKLRGAISTVEWNELLEWAAAFDAVPVLAVGGRGVRYWELTGRKERRGERPMVPFHFGQAAA